jgi:nicotinamidase-related amidase
MGSQEKPTVIGNSSNFWRYTVRDGFDLTHPETPSSPQVMPRLSMQTANTPMVIAPSKTALIVIDMQNFFLSSALGRPGQGRAAEKMLLDFAIPAARKAHIQVVWLNWGLTDEDLHSMSPTVLRGFGFRTKLAPEDGVFAVPADAVGPTEEERDPIKAAEGLEKGTLLARGQYMAAFGLGDSIGDVQLGNGKVVDGGRLLMRDQWNTALHPPLADARKEGLNASPPDVLFHKNRISGMTHTMTDCTDFLHERGIRTLLFAGVNTDQCVLGTLQDASLKGFDTILLKDGCGTRTGDFAQKTCEINCSKTWGFAATCKDFADGVDNLVGILG